MFCQYPQPYFIALKPPHPPGSTKHIARMDRKCISRGSALALVLFVLWGWGCWVWGAVSFVVLVCRSFCSSAHGTFLPLLGL